MTSAQNPPLWSRDEAIAATAGQAAGNWGRIEGISIDTRTLAPGDLFVALQGPHRDGHDFVAQALAAGAGAAMVAHKNADWAEDTPLLLVEDTLEGLSALARAARARTDAQIIAVTGSVGKTSTKDMIHCMLGGQGPVHAAEKSYNNHWGVPLTLARMPRTTHFAVLEIGMNHPGEIGPLSRLVRPHVAIITSIEPVHLAAFADMHGIAKAKAEIFTGLGPDGIAIINTDNRFFDFLAQAAPGKVIGFGTQAQDFHLDQVLVTEHATVIRAHVDGEPLAFKLDVIGEHFAANALAGLAAVRAVGGDLTVAAMALAQWHAPEGRGTRRRILLGPGGLDGSFLLIDESYNANPASMRAALAVLGASPVTNGIGRVARGRRIALLGDMLELGVDETEFHRSLAALPELANIDTIHCCGPQMRAMYDALPAHMRGQWSKDSATMAQTVPKRIDSGDACMVKGSLGSKMNLVVSALESLGTIAEER